MNSITTCVHKGVRYRATRELPSVVKFSIKGELEGLPFSMNGLFSHINLSIREEIQEKNIWDHFGWFLYAPESDMIQA